MAAHACADGVGGDGRDCRGGRRVTAWPVPVAVPVASLCIPVLPPDYGSPRYFMISPTS